MLVHADRRRSLASCCDALARHDGAHAPLYITLLPAKMIPRWINGGQVEEQQTWLASGFQSLLHRAHAAHKM